MGKDKKNEYANLLINAYNRGVLKIVWTTFGFTLGIDSKRKEQITELKEKEFVDYAFSIIKIVMDMAENKEIEDISEKDLEIAKIIYNKEKDLKNHLWIKQNSKINCFKLLESQIISYRNEENPKEIEVNLAIIKIVAEKDDDDISYSFEISRRDLGDVIDKLIELEEKMDTI